MIAVDPLIINEGSLPTRILVQLIECVHNGSSGGDDMLSFVTKMRFLLLFVINKFSQVNTCDVMNILII